MDLGRCCFFTTDPEGHPPTATVPLRLLSPATSFEFRFAGVRPSTSRVANVYAELPQLPRSSASSLTELEGAEDLRGCCYTHSIKREINWRTSASIFNGNGYDESWVVAEAEKRVPAQLQERGRCISRHYG